MSNVGNDQVGQETGESSISPGSSSSPLTAKVPGSKLSPGQWHQIGCSSSNRFCTSKNVRRALYGSSQGSRDKVQSEHYLSQPVVYDYKNRNKLSMSQNASRLPMDNLLEDMFDNDSEPLFHESVKRKFDAANLEQTSQTSSPKKVSKNQLKKTPQKTPQKNTILNYFSSPSKPSCSYEVAKQSDDIFVKKVEVDLTNSPCDVHVSTCSEFNVGLSEEFNDDGENDSDSTYVSDTELQAMQSAQIAEKTNETNQKLYQYNIQEELSAINDLFNSGKLSWEWDDEDDATPCHFDKLPSEMMQKIFCQLPFRDLFLNLCFVSKRWHQIIYEESFLRWKKMYHKLKCKISTAEDFITSLCTENSMNDADLCLRNMLQFVKTFRTLKSCEIENMLLCLRLHSKYHWATALLRERLPDCFLDIERPNPWSVIAAISILAHNVEDISRMLDCLTHRWSSCSLLHVIEFMYCLATLFLHFKTSFSLNSGYHYRIYHALYLFENKGTVYAKDLSTIQNKSSGQQTVRRYVDADATIRLTHEQKYILNHSLQPGDIIKIVAFAGTGKTTTLVEFTKIWPSKYFLNVSFNKSVQKHAARIFPNNVKCLTAHAIAYQAVGKWYKNKLAFELKAYELMKLMKGENVMLRAGIALKTIENFITSADELITIAHVPAGRANKEETFTPEMKLLFCNDAINIWEQMKDVRNTDVKITHDTYLKLYQMEKRPIEGYNCILLDEAQDYSPAMLAMFMNQQCPKIIVGDPHQQVYAFRGAVNSMDSISATHSYYLTQSFRFGPEIAYVASCCLETTLKQTQKTIVGIRKPGGYSGKTKGQVAFISRTNFALFAEAVRICCLENQQIRGAFVGNIQHYALNQLMDIYNLRLVSQGAKKRGNVSFKTKISHFKSFDALVDYAETADDVELQGKIRIVISYGHNLPSHIAKIKEKCSYSLEQADVVFSTAHKAKGQEFDTVKLADDFLVDCFKYNRPYLRYVNKELTDDEASILYVAITRAKDELILSPSAIKMLLVSGERFEYPFSPDCFKNEEWFETGLFRCVSCGKFKPFPKERAIIMKRVPIKLSTGGCVKEGPFCYICVHNPYFYPSDFTISLHTAPACIDNNHRALSLLVGPLDDAEFEEATSHAIQRASLFSMVPCII